MAMRIAENAGQPAADDVGGDDHDAVGADAGIARRLLVLADRDRGSGRTPSGAAPPSTIAATMISAMKRVRARPTRWSGPAVSHSSVGKLCAEAEAGGGVVGVEARDAAIDQQAAQRDDEGLHAAAW